jgi:hypothetical protein
VAIRLWEFNDLNIDAGIGTPVENHLSKKYTLAELEPGWPEDLSVVRTKSSPRTHGSMMMALRRVSRNPENSRLYTHGDPVSLIDWKAFARTDELIMREHRDEASARVAIVIDGSPTTRWPDPRELTNHGIKEKATPKIELSVRLALYLAHAHLTAGDIVHLGMLDEQGDVSRVWIPRSPSDVLGLFTGCLRSGFLDALESFMTVTDWHSLSFDRNWWISDFLSGQSWFDKWKRLKGLNVLHVFSWLEMKTDWMDGPTSYRDEPGGSRIFLGDQLKQGELWARQLTWWQSRIEKAARTAGGQYIAAHDHMLVGDFFHWLTSEAAG